MAAQREPESEARHRAGDYLDKGRRERLERDWRLPMHERLARVRELSKQMTTIAGAAGRR